MEWARFLRACAIASLSTGEWGVRSAVALAELADCILTAQEEGGDSTLAAAPARLALARAAARRAMASDERSVERGLDAAAAAAVAAAPQAAVAAFPSVLSCLLAASRLPATASAAAAAVPKLIGAGLVDPAKVVALVDALLCVGDASGRASRAAEAALLSSAAVPEVAAALSGLVHAAAGPSEGGDAALGAALRLEPQTPDARLGRACRSLELALRYGEDRGGGARHPIPASVVDAAFALAQGLVGAEPATARDEYALGLCLAAIEAGAQAVQDGARCGGSVAELLLRIACRAGEPRARLESPGHAARGAPRARSALQALRAVARCAPAAVAPHAVAAAVAVGHLEDADAALVDAALREALVPWLKERRRKTKGSSAADVRAHFLFEVLGAAGTTAMSDARARALTGDALRSSCSSPPPRTSACQMSAQSSARRARCRGCRSSQPSTRPHSPARGAP